MARRSLRQRQRVGPSRFRHQVVELPPRERILRELLHEIPSPAADRTDQLPPRRDAGSDALLRCEFDEDETGRDVFIDADGDLGEVRRVGDQEVIVHYKDVPEKDVTVVDGIPCTTALRTVIDIAVDTDEGELVRIVRECLDRRLFDVSEARARIAEDDMRDRRGAKILGRVLDAMGTTDPPSSG